MLGLWIDLTSLCERSSRLAPLTRSAVRPQPRVCVTSQWLIALPVLAELAKFDRERHRESVCSPRGNAGSIQCPLASQASARRIVASGSFQGCRVTPAGGSNMLKFFLARLGCSSLTFCGTTLVGVSGKDRHAPDQRTSCCHRFTLDKSGHRTRLRPQRFRGRYAIRLRLGQRGRIRQHRRGC